MQTTFALLAALATAAYAAPQGVTADITPTAAAPAGCATSYSGKFQITAVNFTASAKAKRDIEKRACGDEGSLTITLAGGQLTDGKGRTGYIADNRQFQFDAPPQTGAVLTGGFSACSNGSLALGGSAVWYQCYSGGFYNLYDESQGLQCSEILLYITSCGGSVGVSSDGQATGTAIASQITDGQPQVTTAVAASQLSDGQPQVTTAVAISELSDGQPQVPSAVPLCPIAQIGDGQIQATSACVPVVSQISDGQVQVSTAVPVPTSTAAPISQISDGQIQAPTAAATKTTAAPVSQISDGQVQAGNATVITSATSSAPAQVTANAASSVMIGSQFAAMVGGLVAVVLL